MTGLIETGHVADDDSVQRTVVRAFLERAGLQLPLARLTKRRLLADATRRGFAHLLALTWTCDGLWDESDVWPCGRCESCQHRIIPAVALATARSV